jgi:hypothetical protein
MEALNNIVQYLVVAPGEVQNYEQLFDGTKTPYYSNISIRHRTNEHFNKYA